MISAASQTATHILLVEDTMSDAELVRGYLQDNGADQFNIVHAPTMAAALPILAEQTMQAVMLDLLLPDAAELEGLAGVQAVAPDIPVLILTGRDDEVMASAAVEKGAQDYLLKDKINAPMLRRSLQRAIQRKRHESGLLYQAYFDRLSGLPNRDLFSERFLAALARQERSGHKIGVMMLDLNGFKQINDTHGHAAGDEVLREIGRRLAISLRPYDMAARLGGDEFVVLVEDGKLPCDYGTIARKLIEIIELPMIAGGHQIKIGVSIGIAILDATRKATPELLLREADTAMYWAKAQGVSAYKFFQNQRQKTMRRVMKG